MLCLMLATLGSKNLAASKQQARITKKTWSEGTGLARQLERAKI